MVKKVALVLLVLWITGGVLHLALDEEGAPAPEPLGDVLDAGDPAAEGEAAADVDKEEGQVGLATRAAPRKAQVAPLASAPARPLPAWLRKAVGSSPLGWSGMAAALEALSRRRSLWSPGSQQAFLALAQRRDAPQELRVLAAFLALGGPGEDAQKSTAWISALTVDGRFHRAHVRLLLEHLEEMGVAGQVFLPAVLALEERPFAILNGRARLLRACLAIAPDHPRVTNLMLCALGRHGQAAEFVRKRLLDGTPGDRQRLISSLGAASGQARVTAVRFLLEAGVPGSEVGYLLLPALRHKNHAVRTGAVTLLARSGLDVADVAPIIEALFAHEDEARWLTGIEALGALGRMSGEKRTVVDLLFVAARLPNTKVRTVAVQTLLMYDGESRQIIPILADLLNDTEAQVRREAVDGLGELSAHDESARRYLQTALGDTDQTVREVAQYWLADEDADEGD